MKKAISILLIIMVNALFLTHAVLPHHHHDGIPHFTFFGGNHHHHEYEEDGCCCPVSEEKPCDDNCAFEKEIDVIVASDEEDNYCIACGASHNHTEQLLQAILLPILYESFLPDDERPVKIPPYLISYQTDYVSQALGLRAPPVA